MILNIVPENSSEKCLKCKYLSEPRALSETLDMNISPDLRL